MFRKIFYTPSLLLESFKPFVGVFLKKFIKFSHKMVSRFFQSPSIYVRKLSLHLCFLTIFLSYNCYYEKYSDGSVKNIQDEIPFELPAGWAWSRLGFLAQYKKGPFGSSITKSMFVPDSNQAIKVYEQKNAIEKNAEIGRYFISQEKYKELRAFEIFPNDIIVSCAGTIGETFVMPHNMRKGIINQALMKISLYNLQIIDFYLIYFDFRLKSLANEQGYGVALKNIPPFDILKKYLVPIPPINEQYRIIKENENILNLIQQIGNNRNELNKIKTLLKSKILELAIQGKLVPQDKNDEPANVLLERIRADRKAKLGKKYIESYIYKGDDNCYYEKIGKNSVDITESFAFEVPPKWEICRLESIVEMYTGNSINESDKAKKYIGLSDGYNYIATKDISFNHTVNYDNGVKIPYGEPKFKIAYKGDPLLCIEGGSAGRKIAILSEDVCFVNKLCVFHSLGVNKKYLYYYLQSPQFCELFKKNTSGLIGGVSINTLKSLYFMLPPLSEQLRIVCAVEKVFSYIDEIEKGLN